MFTHARPRALSLSFSLSHTHKRKNLCQGSSLSTLSDDAAITMTDRATANEKPGRWLRVGEREGGTDGEADE